MKPKILTVALILAVSCAGALAQSSKWPLLAKVDVKTGPTITVSVVDPVHHTEGLFAEWTAPTASVPEFFSKSHPLTPARIHKGKLEINYADDKGKMQIITVHATESFHPNPCIFPGVRCGGVWP